MLQCGIESKILFNRQKSCPCRLIVHTKMPICKLKAAKGSAYYRIAKYKFKKVALSLIAAASIQKASDASKKIP